MDESSIPDECHCGGRLEYYGNNDGMEFWRCMNWECGETYMRYHDCGSGGG